ncbi:MAG: kinetochore-associated Ndc80 complex subunit spc25 [Candelina submexicana]|nr:MAG: kinetochore-associated Ndc80 complex subunit spc25 [Candelina submexicana]
MTSFSTSVMRAPYSTADAPSMADSLPSINFSFDELRDCMTKFTIRFDDFIEKGRKRILAERNQFRINVAELEEDQRMKKKDIEILTLQSNAHAQTVAKEAQELSEMHIAIDTLTVQLDDRAAARDQLKQQIAETKKAIAQQHKAQQEYARYLDGQQRFNIHELDFWHDYLCLRINGAGVEDQLKFVFTHVDGRDPEREAWFELGMRKKDYEVLHCKPKIEGEKVADCVEKLNETRDLGPFLKGMRELFISALR